MDPLVQVINFQRDDMDEEEDGDDSSEVVSEEEDDEDEDEMEHDGDSDDAASRKTTKAPSAYTCGMCGKVRTSITLLQCSLNHGCHCRPAAFLPIAIMLLVAALRNRPNRDFVLLQFSNSGTHHKYLFSSPLLSQGFKKKSLMTAHERIHNDDRPYACMDCPKAFRDLGALNSHKIRLHSRENLKFSCELCRCVCVLHHDPHPHPCPARLSCCCFLTIPLPSTSIPFHLSADVRRRLRRLLNTLVVVFVLSGPC